MVSRILRVMRGWWLLMLLPAAVIVLVPDRWPRWALMWLLAFSIYLGCKWLTWRRSYVAGATAQRHVGYVLAWPGMDAHAFLNPAPLPVNQRPSVSEWTAAIVKFTAAIAVLWTVPRLIADRSNWDLLAGWTGMIAMIFVLHFGLLHIISCAWRAGGVRAERLMNNPLAAQSLAEFWGRRWNVPFRDLTHRFLFRPLTQRLGQQMGLITGFLMSGLVHDLLISYPAGAGYGLPTLYFMLQCAGILLERSRLGRGVRGRVFTLVVTAAPAVILFHPPFVRIVILPFLQVIGAL